VGGTPHRCVACSVMCAQRMFPVRLAVGVGGALNSECFVILSSRSIGHV